jgi:hypothetical protein
MVKKRGRKSYKNVCKDLIKNNEQLYNALYFVSINLTKADFIAIITNCLKFIDGKPVFTNFFKKRYLFKNNMFYLKDGYFILKKPIFEMFKPYLEKNSVEIVYFIE